MDQGSGHDRTSATRSAQLGGNLRAGRVVLSTRVESRPPAPPRRPLLRVRAVGRPEPGHQRRTRLAGSDAGPCRDLFLSLRHVDGMQLRTTPPAVFSTALSELVSKHGIRATSRLVGVSMTTVRRVIAGRTVNPGTLLVLQLHLGGELAA